MHPISRSTVAILATLMCRRRGSKSRAKSHICEVVRVPSLGDHEEGAFRVAELQLIGMRAASYGSHTCLMTVLMESWHILCIFCFTRLVQLHGIYLLKTKTEEESAHAFYEHYRASPVGRWSGLEIYRVAYDEPDWNRCIANQGLWQACSKKRERIEILRSFLDALRDWGLCEIAAWMHIHDAMYCLISTMFPNQIEGLLSKQYFALQLSGPQRVFLLDCRGLSPVALMRTFYIFYDWRVNLRLVGVRSQLFPSASKETGSPLSHDGSLREYSFEPNSTYLQKFPIEVRQQIYAPSHCRIQRLVRSAS